MSETDHPSPSPVSLELLEKFTKILRSNGINDEIASVTMKDAELQGAGLTSQANFVTISFKDSAKESLQLFIKTGLTNASESELLSDPQIFRQESIFLMELLPEVKQFLKRLGREDLLIIYPKCYHGDSGMIVLENLVLSKGLEMLDKKELRDLDTARLAVTILAKHHAVTYAFIKDAGGPEVFATKYPSFFFQPFTHPLVKTMMAPSVERGIELNIELLERSTVEGKEEALELLKSKAGKGWDCIGEALDDTQDHGLLRVLLHGDFHNQNQLFLRDKATNKLVDMVAIDFQVVRYEVPTTDLCYYFYTSVKPEVRRDHLKDLLGTYLEVLNATTKELGTPVNLTYDQLYQSYRKRFQFGFWFCGMLTTKAATFGMEDLGINVMEMGKSGVKFLERAKHWIRLNPKSSEEDAKELVKLTREYKTLLLP